MEAEYSTKVETAQGLNINRGGFVTKTYDEQQNIAIGHSDE